MEKKQENVNMCVCKIILAENVLFFLICVTGVGCDIPVAQEHMQDRMTTLDAIESAHVSTIYTLIPILLIALVLITLYYKRKIANLKDIINHLQVYTSNGSNYGKLLLQLKYVVRYINILIVMLYSAQCIMRCFGYIYYLIRLNYKILCDLKCIHLPTHTCVMYNIFFNRLISALRILRTGP